jgi:hypothetical protein
MVNDKIYIHEFIDIIGHRRAEYMHHMTANWSPIAQEERHQRCFGVWAVLGSTGRWPEVVNIWEHDGWEGLADSFATEAVGRGAQDPSLERWWAKASEFRRGGFDRIIEPAPWTRSIAQLCADGVTGQCYAHEVIKMRPGTVTEFLQRLPGHVAPLAQRHGWELVGGWRTAMANDDECIVLWAVPTWRAWAAFEQDRECRDWPRSAGAALGPSHRILLVDAPLSPFRTGRQPTRADRTDWVD